MQIRVKLLRCLNPSARFFIVQGRESYIKNCLLLEFCQDFGVNIKDVKSLNNESSSTYSLSFLSMSLYVFPLYSVLRIFMIIYVRVIFKICFGNFFLFATLQFFFFNSEAITSFFNNSLSNNPSLLFLGCTLVRRWSSGIEPLTQCFQTSGHQLMHRIAGPTSRL